MSLFTFFTRKDKSTTITIHTEIKKGSISDTLTVSDKAHELRLKEIGKIAASPEWARTVRRINEEYEQAEAVKKAKKISRRTKNN
jgi:hypothetical protein